MQHSLQVNGFSALKEKQKWDCRSGQSELSEPLEEFSLILQERQTIMAAFHFTLCRKSFVIIHVF